MAFHEQELGAFLAAKEAASDILQDQGSKTRPLRFEEALVMQAASHLLLTSETFYGLEVATLVAGKSGTIYPILRRFDTEYDILEGAYEPGYDPELAGRPQRRVYAATQLGERVFELFQSNIEQQ